MDHLIIQRFSVFQKQSAIGSVVLFFQSLRKNSFNFLYLILPAIKGNFKISLFLLLGFIVLLAVLAYIKYYYFNYKFDFDKSAFIIRKGFLKKTNLSIPFEKIQQININQNLIHKIFNLYEIQMDTAGSKSTEVDIKAVSKLIAQDFKIIAEQIKKLSDLEIDNTSVEGKEKSFEIDFITLVKTGLTTRYFETFSLIGGGLFLGVQFMEDLKRNYTSEAINLIGKVDYNLGVISLIALLIILTVLITNLISTLIKYYRYKAIRKSEKLEINYGLIQTKSVLISPIKVQQFQTTQNWLQKIMGIIDVKINQASSQRISRNNKKNIAVPGCTYNQKQILFEFIFDKKINNEFIIKPNIRKFIINFSFLSLTPSLIMGIVYMKFNFFEHFYWLMSIGSYFIISLFMCWRFYKNNTLFISKSFIRLQSGFWDIKTKYIEQFKIQSVIISQPLWYKSSNLGDIIIFTAGGRITFRTCKFSTLKLILNNIALNVETSTKKWM